MNKKSFWLGLITCIVLVITFTHSLLFNITKPLSLDHWDAFAHTFILKHYHELISGRWGQITTSDMFYGFEGSQFFFDPFITQAILSAPIYLLTKNSITTYNFLSVVTLILSILSMYFFVYFLTHKILVSILGAVIYTLNPFTLGHFPDQLQLYSLQWIPLIFLFLEKSLKDKTRLNIFLFFLFLTAQLFSSLYYMAFLSVVLPIYGTVRLIQTKLSAKNLLNLGAILGVLLFGASCLIIITLYKPIFKGFTDNSFLINMAPLSSASLSDWFSTTSQNFLYGKDKKILFEWEHSLFWGITPIILFILSLIVLRKSANSSVWFIFLVLLVLSFLISLGPKVQIYTLIYYLNPLFHNIRVPSRMGVFVFFFLSLISALTVKEIIQRMTPRLAQALAIFIILIILVEYWNKPLQFAEISSETTQAYSFLNSQSQIRVILEYPMFNRLPPNHPNFRLEDLDTHYLLYASIFHNKKLLNGVGTFYPEQYQERTFLLSLNFPTKERLIVLKNWEVDAIFLHKEEFNKIEQFERVKKDLLSLNVPLIYSSANLSLFDLSKWVN